MELKDKSNDEYSFMGTDLHFLIEYANKVPDSSDFIIRALEKGINPLAIRSKLCQIIDFQKNEKRAREVLLTAAFNERLFEEQTTIFYIKNYLNRPYNPSTRKENLSMLKAMIENEFFPTDLITEITRNFNDITDSPADDDKYYTEI